MYYYFIHTWIHTYILHLSYFKVQPKSLANNAKFLPTVHLLRLLPQNHKPTKPVKSVQRIYHRMLPTRRLNDWATGRLVVMIPVRSPMWVLASRYRRAPRTVGTSVRSLIDMAVHEPPPPPPPTAHHYNHPWQQHVSLACIISLHCTSTLQGLCNNPAPLHLLLHSAGPTHLPRCHRDRAAISISLHHNRFILIS